MKVKYWITFAAFLSATLGYQIIKPKQPKILTSIELSDKTQNYAETNKFEKSYIAYEWTLDRNHNGIFDCVGDKKPENCDQFLISVPTDKEIVLTLDWESEIVESVKAGKKEAIEQFKIAFYYFKYKRPKAKIGYYGIPETRYYQRDIDSWNKSAALYAPILEMVDLYFPSLYDFYPDRSTPGHSEADDLTFVKWNIERALSIPSKPVYVFIWHRFHSNGGPDTNSTLIPATEMLNFAQAATVKLHGRQIYGFIWWGSDFYIKTQAQKTPPEPASLQIMQSECSSNQNAWTDCIDNYHRFYIDEVLKKLKF